MAKKRKKQRRRVLILAGPDRGRKAMANRINLVDETCRVTFGEGADERSYYLSLDAVAFEDVRSPATYLGLSPDLSDELDTFGFTLTE